MVNKYSSKTLKNTLLFTEKALLIKSNYRMNKSLHIEIIVYKFNICKIIDSFFY